MAIKRINPKAKFKVVVAQDDAVISETADELKALEIVAPDGKPVLDETGKPKRNPTRYERYLESFDPAVLKFKDDVVPTFFVVRGMTNLESADFNERYFQYDVVKKEAKQINRAKMLLEIFALACEGTEENGKASPITSDEVPYGVAMEVGSIIQLISVLNKNLKNG